MTFAAFLLVVVFSFQAETKLTEHTLAAPQDAAPATADLAEFKFLRGAWTGTGLGARCDETWSSPGGDCMLGTFRMVKDGQLRFTEFCMIQKDERGGVVLRLKHFGRDFHGWEQKDEFESFPLIRVEENTAYFQGLTYAIQSDGTLKVWVAMEEQTETWSELEFHFRRTATSN